MFTQKATTPQIELIRYFNSIYPVTQGFIDEIVTKTFSVNVKKNKFLLSPLEPNNYLFFVNSGIVRGFIKEEGKDISTWFSFGKEIIGAFRDPGNTIKPSIEYLQALEDSELLAIPYDLIDQLYLQFPETNIISRKIFAMQYHQASERSILARIPSAQKRYERFIEISPLGVTQLPLKCIASYLGMRMETLSRIRNKIVRSKKDAA
ncbi:Crp/Fnr family transcriptional regulator [Pedobacter fastidiosus]|uniref:Crp/Fnr family transcriptional regulator n=1 Tax=Pedobacter fastidiosus TaxID=2765361 RepID=A0ABR7KRZ7_9SPHI|nr:Crp/Fnr family transcriptional regulator [Pedobacter fastidiosus]MBC6110864.1 Crp/Fnr family transcriptional regulator [Pedobacter fastidiosus]